MFQTEIIEKLEICMSWSIAFFCPFENHAVYEKMWKNIVERGRSQMTIWRMRIACWIPEATNAHTHTHTHTQVV